MSVVRTRIAVEHFPPRRRKREEDVTLAKCQYLRPAVRNEAYNLIIMTPPNVPKNATEAAILARCTSPLAIHFLILTGLTQHLTTGRNMGASLPIR